jgi:hypothetical protein
MIGLYIGDFAALIVGMMAVIGTKLRWKFLVDPPEKWAFFYSQSWLKQRFGRDFLILYNYVVGGLFIAFSVFMFCLLVSGRW